ncbi:transcription factor S [archaeon]|nr:transcription factor S [archaeon]
MIANLFCPKCGTMMLPEEKKMKCSGCGYSPRGKQDKLVLTEKIALSKKQEIEVQDKKVETLPKIKEDCPKCGAKFAYYWTLQTRSADESETRFFECVKCGNRWRVN